MIKFVHATKQHAKQLAKRGLRPIDQLECRALGQSPRKALKAGVENSKFSWAMLDDSGRPLALFGVAPHPTDDKLGIPWFLGCSEVYEHRLTFVKYTRHYLAVMQHYFPKLVNVVHADNEKSIRWLKWAGFTVTDEPRTYGPHSEPFLAFYKQRH